ncbi:hypothetical protein [Microbacterium sp. RG1]|uniref:hypothetical protein n=1 Tax=Microbacterium sp. RG1 TaxID=2489212 RepID=UPI0010CA4827|nr:hypothetical protein [Microbacterium sp. RG1]QCQ15902.1 hypothetical protein EHF32_03690 [Microbacterium sp. RG1]
MSHQDYEAALDDLKQDATAWSTLSGTFAEVRTIVDGCELGRWEMDGFGHMSGAEANYNTAHQTIYTLIDSAVAELQSVSDKLLETKRNYEAADGYSQWLLDQG